MSRKVKAVFIGPEETATKIASELPHWNFSNILKDLEQFWEGLKNNTIEEDFHVIITVDGLYNPLSTNGVGSFENFVALMHPFCLFVILSENEHAEQQIKQKVESESNGNGLQEKEKFYFVRTKNFRKEMETVVDDYISNTGNFKTASLLAETTL